MATRWTAESTVSGWRLREDGTVLEVRPASVQRDDLVMAAMLGLGYATFLQIAKKQLS